MKDKIKDSISKYKSLNQEGKSLYFYGVIFVILLLVGLVLKITGKLEPKKTYTSDNTKQEEVVENDVNDYAEIINEMSGNYEEDITVYWYDSISYADIDLNGSKKPLTGLYKKEFINIKKDGALFAAIPPTFAAARNTYSGFSSKKNFSTAT